MRSEKLAFEHKDILYDKLRNVPARLSEYSLYLIIKIIRC